jgi:hypothetical protein
MEEKKALVIKAVFTKAADMQLEFTGLGVDECLQ